MTRLSQEEGVISPHDWKLNAEGRSELRQAFQSSEARSAERT